jgi:GNAT superfamily N-acetyltransferase
MVAIRPAQKEDAEALCSFARRFPVDTYVDEPRFSRYLTDANTCLVAARDADQVVGYVLGFDRHSRVVDCRAAEVEEIMVAEDFRRKRIGKSLIECFEDWARTRGCPLILIGGAPAADFYRALGYQMRGIHFIKGLL